MLGFKEDCDGGIWVKRKHPKPTIVQSVFPSTLDYYWSSTVYEESERANWLWTVSFSSGEVYYHWAKGGTTAEGHPRSIIYARLVRK